MEFLLSPSSVFSQILVFRCPSLFSFLNTVPSKFVCIFEQIDCHIDVSDEFEILPNGYSDLLTGNRKL